MPRRTTVSAGGTSARRAVAVAVCAALFASLTTGPASAAVPGRDASSRAVAPAEPGATPPPVSTEPLTIAAPAVGEFVTGPVLHLLVQAADPDPVLTVALNGRPVAVTFTASENGFVADLPLGDAERGPAVLSVRSGASDGGSSPAAASVAFTVGIPDGNVARWEVDDRLDRNTTLGAVPVAFSVEPGARYELSVNDRPVTRRLPGAPTKVAVLLGADDGVRHGTNTVRLRGIAPNGRYTDLSSQWFVVPLAPLAAAVTEARVPAGRPVMLDGTGSTPGVFRGVLTHRWRVVQEPAPGAADLPADPQAAAGAAPASFTPTVAGHYVLALDVTETVRFGPWSFPITSTALLGMAAVASVPPVGALFDTFGQQGGETGLLISSGVTDETVWPVYPGLFVPYTAAPQSVYMTVVGKTSLSRQPASTVVPTQASDAALLSALQTAAADQRNSAEQFLVVVTRPQDGPATGALPSGPFSHVFDLPDTVSALTDVAGVGTWNRGLRLEPGGVPGRISGHLQLDATGDVFQLVQGKVADFDTRDGGIASSIPADGAVLRIIDSGSGRPLSADGTSVDLSWPPGVAPGTWEFRFAYGNSYQLMNRETGTCLAATGAAVATATCAAPGVDRTSQLWSVVRRADGGFTIGTPGPAGTASSGGSVLAVAADLPALVDQAQGQGAAWRLGPLPGSFGLATPDGSAVVAAQQAAGVAPLVQSVRLGGADEQWTLVDQTADGSFTLVSGAGGMCMEVTGASTAAGAAVQQNVCAASGSQRWRTLAQSDGTYRLQSVNSGLVLTGSATATGGVLTQQVPRPARDTSGDTDNSEQQNWAFTTGPSPTPGSTVALTAARSWAALTAGATAGSAAVTGAVSFGADQWWQVQDAGHGDGSVLLRNPATGMCLAVAAVSMGAGAESLPCASATAWTINQRTAPAGTTPGVGNGYEIVARSPGGPQLVLNTETGPSLAPRSDAATDQTWMVNGLGTAFTVADRRHPVTLPPRATATQHRAGFAVLAIDPAAQPLPGYPRMYPTNTVNPTLDSTVTTALAADLETLAATPGTGVLVQSIGKPGPTDAHWPDIATAIGKLGGLAGPFNAMDGTTDYALAGCSSCKGKVDTPELNPRSYAGIDPAADIRLTGQLDRANDSTLRATPAAPGTGLADLVDRPATPWPFGDTQGAAALASIARQLQLTGLPASSTCPGAVDQVRAAYCANITWGPGTPHDITTVSYQATDAYDEAFFDLVRTQVQREVAQLGEAREFIADLRSVYLGDGGQITRFAASSISAAIQATLTAEPGTSRHTLGIALLTGLSVLANTSAALYPPLRIVGAALSVASLGVKYASRNASGTVPAPQITAATAADQLQQEVAAAVAQLPRLQQSIVSDPDRLAAAAANNSTVWSMSDTTIQQVQTYNNMGAARFLWTQLLTTYQLHTFATPPAGYSITELWVTDDVTTSHKVFAKQPAPYIHDARGTTYTLSEPVNTNPTTPNFDLLPNFERSIDDSGRMAGFLFGALRPSDVDPYDTSAAIVPHAGLTWEALPELVDFPKSDHGTLACYLTNTNPSYFYEHDTKPRIQTCP